MSASQLFGLVFRDIVVRQALIFVDIGSNVLLVGVGSTFADFDFAAVGLDVGRSVLAVVALGCINNCCLGCLFIIGLRLLLPQPAIMLTLSSIARKNAKSFCISMLLS